jgi:hypothetical protein
VRAAAVGCLPAPLRQAIVLKQEFQRDSCGLCNRSMSEGATSKTRRSWLHWSSIRRTHAEAKTRRNRHASVADMRGKRWR